MEQRQVREVFSNLRSVYEDREQYNLEWAYKNAQGEMDSFRSKILKGDLEKQCALCDKKKEALEQYHNLMANSRVMKKKSKWYQRFFENIYSVLTLVEVAVSVALVFLLSQLSHMGGAMIHSEGFSILFAMTFAFLKVVLERYWIEPRMKAWGWKIYIDSVERLDQKTMEVMDIAAGNDERMAASPTSVGVIGEMQGAVI